MAALFLIVVPAVFFALVGRAASPASAATGLRAVGTDLVRGLRLCAMNSPQFLRGSTR
jgi:hypothetical protein